MKVLNITMTKNKASILSSTKNSSGDEKLKDEDDSNEVEKTAMSSNLTPKNKRKNCLNS